MAALDPTSTRSPPLPNALLSAHVRQHTQPSLPVVDLDALSRYPIPVLTAAGLADVAAPSSSTRRDAALAPHDSTLHDGSANETSVRAATHLEAMSSAVHSFWQGANSRSALANSCVEGTVSSSGLAPLPRTAVMPSWTSQSPFRACADPAFHARLQRCAATPSPVLGHPLRPLPENAGLHTLNGPYTRIDGLCHGFEVPTVAGRYGAASARKRLRTQTEPAQDAFPGGGGSGAAQTVTAQSPRTPPADTAGAAAARAALRHTGAEAEVERGVMGHTLALQSRVEENDELLDLLLGQTDSATTTAAAAAAGRGVASCCQDAMAGVQTEGRAAAVEANATALRATDAVAASAAQKEVVPAPPAKAASAADGPVAAVVPPSQVGASVSDVPLSTRSVKELKDMCGRLGLLCTGSKPVLLQRIAVYEATRRERETLQTQHQQQQQQQQQAAPQQGSLLSSSRSDTMTLPAQHPRSPPLATASVRSASGSPPRTVFRYRSPSLPCDGRGATSATGDAAATPLCAGAECGREGLGSTPAAPKAAAAVRPSRRLVPSPTEFLQQLTLSQTHALSHPPCPPQPHGASTPAAIRCSASPTARGETGGSLQALRGAAALPSRTPATATTAAAARAAEERLKQEASAVRWQWLVDYRERAGHHGRGGGGRSKHEGMMDAFRKQQVPCTSVMLPSGDFMLAVELTQQEAAQLSSQPNAALEQSTRAVEKGRHVEEAATPAAAAAPPGEPPLLGHLCSIVVERKTAADLDASVKGSRYSEQRRLLAATPYALVVWLIEGSDVGGGRGYGKQHGFAPAARSRSPSPVPSHTDASPASSPFPPPASPATPLESARLRVDSACASLGLHRPGWVVVRTRNTAESVLFLKQMAGQVARQLASLRLMAGEASATEDAGGGTRSSYSFLLCPGGGAALTPARPPFQVLTPYRRSSDGARLLDGVGPSCRLSLLRFAPTQECLRFVGALQRRLRAQTAFPRMLMCVRGCSPALAALLCCKYGSLMGFWRALRVRGREACDADADIRRLSTAQKKVFILLTEFLLSKDYY